MTRAKRTFTPEERLSLLQEAERYFCDMPQAQSIANNDSFLAKEYLAKGAEGLKPSYRRVDPQVKALEEENERLKGIVARMAMELEMKTEMLKKTPIQFKKSGK